MEETFDFGTAIRKLKEGKKVSRAGWNGKRMWLKFVPEKYYALHVSVEASQGLSVDRLPWIGMKTADNKFVPWLASQTDMLAEDWSECE